jgi:hypothetical protein
LFLDFEEECTMKWMVLISVIVTALAVAASAVAQNDAATAVAPVAFKVSEPPQINVPVKGKSTFYIKVWLTDGKTHDLMIFPGFGDRTDVPNPISLPAFPNLKRNSIGGFDVRVNKWPPGRIYTLKVVVKGTKEFCYGALVAVFVGKKLLPGRNDRGDRCVD